MKLSCGNCQASLLSSGFAAALSKKHMELQRHTLLKEKRFVPNFNFSSYLQIQICYSHALVLLCSDCIGNAIDINRNDMLPPLLASVRKTILDKVEADRTDAEKKLLAELNAVDRIPEVTTFLKESAIGRGLMERGVSVGTTNACRTCGRPF